MTAYDSRGFRNEPGDEAWPIRRGDLSDYGPQPDTSGPLYDCGGVDCEECKRHFGPNRSGAILRAQARADYYATLDANGQESAP